VLEINPGYVELIRERRFDAVFSNTTYHFRANTTNLLSVEFLRLVEDHLAPGGTLFYNTTDSARAQRTACLAYPHGLRFINHMLVSHAPIRLDFARWRQVLTTSRIDDHPVIDPARAEDREILDKLVSALSAPPGEGALIEHCDQILKRTAGLMPITDDNMGTEWRHVFGME
jgi:spermidine synthase